MDEGLKKKLLLIFGPTIVSTFLLLFVVFIAVFIVLGIFDTDNSSGSGSVVINPEEQISVSSSGYYWWPIGGSEVEIINEVEYAKGVPTSTTISSEFSNSRTIEGVTKAHNGIDISSGGNSKNYIIASKDGTVYKANDACSNDGYYQNPCGSGYGNYVVLEHADGNYTIYAHMAQDTVKVKPGDTVKQGQILGEMGNSGSSTGYHLHFQIDVGGYSNDNAVDPLTFVDLENPRPKGASINLITMLRKLEGTGPTDGDYYVAYVGEADASDVVTIGHGVTIKNNVDRFKARGYSDPLNDITKGTKVLKNIVDDVEVEIINELRTTIVNRLNNEGIPLQEYQIDALVSRAYNIGNVNDFYNAYRQYGISQALYDNYMSTGVTANGKVVEGLKIRRDREWKLFSEGKYYGVDY